MLEHEDLEDDDLEPDDDGNYNQYEDDGPDFDDRDDMDDDGPQLSYSQQCWQDRADYAREKLERGEIDEEQADEIRHGA